MAEPKTHDGKECMADKLSADDVHLKTDALRGSSGSSPSLSEATPGLDASRPFRDLALRAVAWGRASWADRSSPTGFATQGKRAARRAVAQAVRLTRRTIKQVRQRGRAKA